MPSVDDYSVSMLRCELNLLYTTRNHHAYICELLLQSIHSTIYDDLVSIQSWNLEMAAQKRKT